METPDRNSIPRYLAGLAAALLSLYFLYRGRAEISVVVSSSFFFLICITDMLYSKIFNATTIALLVAGFAINIADAGLSGLLFSFWGFLAGLGLLLVPYLMGGMGGGDVKALAALGALVGADHVFQVFLYAGLIGGALSLLHVAFSPDLKRRLRDWWFRMKTFFLTREMQSMRGTGEIQTVRFPYATAIAFGFFSWLNWGRII